MKVMKFDADNNVIVKTNVLMCALSSAIIRTDGKFNMPDDEAGEYWMLEQGVLEQNGNEAPVVPKKVIKKVAPIKVEAPVKKEVAPAPSIKKPKRKPRRK